MLPKVAINMTPFKLSHLASRSSQHFQSLRNALNLNVGSAQASQAQAGGLSGASSGASQAGAGAGAGGAKWGAGSRAHWGYGSQGRLLTQSNATSSDASNPPRQDDDEERKRREAMQWIRSSERIPIVGLGRTRSATTSPLAVRGGNLELPARLLHTFNGPQQSPTKSPGTNLPLPPLVGGKEDGVSSIDSASSPSTRRPNSLGKRRNSTSAIEFTPSLDQHDPTLSSPPGARSRSSSMSATSPNSRPPSWDIRAERQEGDDANRSRDDDAWYSTPAGPRKAPPARRQLQGVARDRFDDILASQYYPEADRRIRHKVDEYLALPAEEHNGQTHSLVIKSLSKITPAEERPTEILQVYNDMLDKGFSPGLSSIEEIIKVLCKREMNVDRISRFLDERKRSRELGLSATAWGIAEAGGMDASEEVTFSVKEEMAERERLASEDNIGIALRLYRALGDQARKLDFHCMDWLLRACAIRGLVDEAISVFGDMERPGFANPSVHSYAYLVEILGKSGDLEGAKEVLGAFEKARGRGVSIMALNEEETPSDVGMGSEEGQRPGRQSVRPSQQVDSERRVHHGAAFVWNKMIAAHIRCGDSAGGIALLEQMLQKDGQEGSKNSATASGKKSLPPPFATANTFLNLVEEFVARGDHDSALRWFDHLLTASPHPAAVYAGADAKARGLYLEQSSQTLPRPNSRTYTTLFYALVDAGRVDDVNNVFNRILENAVSDRLPIRVEELYAAVNLNIREAISKDTDASKAATLLDAALSYGERFRSLCSKRMVPTLPPNFSLHPAVMRRLMGGLAVRGRFEEAAQLFANLVSQFAKQTGSFSTLEEGDIWRDRLAQVDSHVALGISCRSISGPGAPTLSTALNVAKAVRSLGRELSPPISHLIAGLYLSIREQAWGEPARLALNEVSWMLIAESFVRVHHMALTGQEISLNASFEPITVSPSEVRLEAFEILLNDMAQAGVQFSPELRLDSLYNLLQSFLPEGATLSYVTAVTSRVAQPVAPETDPSASPSAASALHSFDERSTSSPTDLSSALSEPVSLAQPITPSIPSYIAANLDPSIPPFTLSRQLGGFVDTKIRHGEGSVALRDVKSQLEAGKVPYPDSLSRLAEHVGREGSSEDVNFLYNLTRTALAVMEPNSEEQIRSWGYLEDRMILAKAGLGDIEGLNYHRHLLLQHNIAPSAEAYGAMILHAKDTTDDATVALALWEEAERFGVKPNVFLYNTLISKLSRARRAPLALHYFESMKQAGLHPSPITYGAVINACCRIGDAAAATYLFDEMLKQPGFKPRVPPYNTMIQFFTQTQPDREKALHYFNLMLKSKVPPSAHTYKLLLDVYGSIEPADTDSMNDVFQRLVADRHVKVAGVHWASVIHAYGCVGKDAERALEVFNSIASHPSSKDAQPSLPDALVYESLFNVFLAHHRLDLVEQYWGEMQSKGIHMTAYVANCLIRARAMGNRLDEARDFFENLADPPIGVAASNNHPTERHPSRRGGGSTRSGVDSVVYREPSTWETMIRAELGAGERERAKALLQRAEGRAFPFAVMTRLQHLLGEVTPDMPSSPIEGSLA